MDERTNERTNGMVVCAFRIGGWGSRPGSRPVPSRRVSHRSPPAIHSSFSQPPACQCPTARRTVCTQKRSGSPSLPRLPPSRETCARARTLFHPGESRIAYPPLYAASISVFSHLPCSFAPTLVRPRYARYFSLFLLAGRSRRLLFLRRFPPRFPFTLLSLLFPLPPLVTLFCFFPLSLSSANLPRSLSLFSPSVTLETHERRLSVSLPPSRSHFPLCRLAGVRRV